MTTNVLLLKSVPMIVAVAGVGWCVWPHVDPSTAPQPAKSEVTPVDARLFNLSLKPASGRNPFEPLEGPGEGPASPPKGGGEAHPVASHPKSEAAKSEAAQPGDDAPVASGSGTQEPQYCWNLGATLVHGRRRAAVINGRVYLLGETVAASTPDGAPARLDQIERDMVFLRVKDRPRPIVLAYAGAGSPQVRSKPAPRPASADNLAESLRMMPSGMDLGRLLGGGGAAPLLDVLKSAGLGGLAK